jgi:adenine-specific DNA glycosylase
MAEIKVTVDEKKYTKEQFKKDLVRMFDICRKSNGNDEDIGEATCRGVNCDACPLSSVCNATKFMSFETIKTVHEWAHEHPVVTNRDKMIETFGGAYFNLIINYISDRSLEDYDIWLHEEYKEPKGESKNDD